MICYILAALSLFAAPAAAQTRFGVNLSGCTFVSNGALCPTIEDAAWYISKAGFRGIRLPINGSQASNPAIMQRVQDIVKTAKARGVPVIVDRHDYAWPTPEAQVAWWLPILRRLNDPNMVMIDLMNEPKGFNDPVLTNDWLQWVRDTNLVIAGIRKAGFKHRILVEWPQYSASFRFDKKEGPSKACESAACALDRSGGLVDPLNRVILSPHRYFDKGSQGGSPVCEADPSNNGGLREFAAAARKRGYKAILGEYAFGSWKAVHATCVARGPGVIAALKADSDVWLYAMAWGGGRGWKEDYLFKMEPTKGTRTLVPIPAYIKTLTGVAK